MTTPSAERVRETPTPWENRDECRDEIYASWVVIHGPQREVCRIVVRSDDGAAEKADADLICAAVNERDGLLSALSAANARAERAEADLAHVLDCAETFCDKCLAAKQRITALRGGGANG